MFVNHIYTQVSGANVVDCISQFFESGQIQLFKGSEYADALKDYQRIVIISYYVFDANIWIAVDDEYIYQS